MELGEKLLLARQEAGLTQKQLCGDRITRNMLSQIEHGTAQPSMDTLRYLAGQLGKSISFFLEDTAVVSANQGLMERVRDAFDAGNASAVLEMLADYREPDEVYDRESKITESRCRFILAEKAMAEGRQPLARELLEQLETLEESVGRYLPELHAGCLKLRAQLQGEDTARLCSRLPSLDAELILRSRGAQAGGEYLRASQLLDAAEDQTTPEWCLRKGEISVLRGEYRAAVKLLLSAEEVYPREAAALLERSYREMGNYKQAYLYACKLRDEPK